MVQPPSRHLLLFLLPLGLAACQLLFPFAGSDAGPDRAVPGADQRADSLPSSEARRPEEGGVPVCPPTWPAARPFCPDLAACSLLCRSDECCRKACLGGHPVSNGFAAMDHCQAVTCKKGCVDPWSPVACMTCLHSSCQSALDSCAEEGPLSPLTCVEVVACLGACKSGDCRACLAALEPGSATDALVNCAQSASLDCLTCGPLSSCHLLSCLAAQCTTALTECMQDFQDG